MVNTLAIEQISESLKSVTHSKLGRYFVTQRDGEYIVLPIEDYRSGDLEFAFFTEIDLVSGLQPSQWWRISDNIFDEEECYE